MKEYRDYESTVGRVADLGVAYESMGRRESPRKPSLSPGKRPSITSCMFRPCHSIESSRCVGSLVLIVSIQVT